VSLNEVKRGRQTQLRQRCVNDSVQVQSCRFSLLTARSRAPQTLAAWLTVYVRYMLLVRKLDECLDQARRAYRPWSTLSRAKHNLPSCHRLRILKSAISPQQHWTPSQPECWSCGRGCARKGAVLLAPQPLRLHLQVCV
jgi:hypothetical protein